MNTDALYPIGFTLTYFVKKMMNILISRAANSKDQQLYLQQKQMMGNTYAWHNVLIFIC